MDLNLTDYALAPNFGHAVMQPKLEKKTVLT